MGLLGIALLTMAIQKQIDLTPRLLISKSTAVATRIYRIPSDEKLEHPAIEIRGDNLTVDFHGATLEGTPVETEPNNRKGLGLLVHGNNVTIKNLHVRGYKVGLIARDCSGLKL